MKNEFKEKYQSFTEAQIIQRLGEINQKQFNSVILGNSEGMHHSLFDK